MLTRLLICKNGGVSKKSFCSFVQKGLLICLRYCMDAGFLVISHPKLTRNMEEMTVINIVYLSMRRQKDAVQDEMNRLTLRLTEMELKMEAERTINNMLLASTGSSAVVAGVATMGETGSAGEPIAAGKERKAAAVDLSAMDDKELFEHISRVIRDEELFRWPDFNRAAAMEQFSLSAARIGGAFMRGGGMGMPEFVRNCRLDYACRLMVEQPELSLPRWARLQAISAPLRSTTTSRLASECPRLSTGHSS